MEYKSIKSALVVFFQPLAKCKQKFGSQKKHMQLMLLVSALLK